MALIDHVVHRVHGTVDRVAVTSSVEEMLDGPDHSPTLDVVGLRSRDVIDAIPPALAAVERQRKLLGLKPSLLG